MVEKKKRKKFEKEIEIIIKNLEKEFSFNANLNAYERKIVHEMAEKNNLYHKTFGDEIKIIKISKIPFDDDNDANDNDVNILTNMLQTHSLAETQKSKDKLKVPFQMELRKRKNKL